MVSPKETLESEFTLAPENISAFEDFTIDDLIDSFSDYRKELHDKITGNSFKVLNEKLDIVDTVINTKDEQILKIRSASNKLRLQLFEMELQFYQNSHGIKIYDETYDTWTSLQESLTNGDPSPNYQNPESSTLNHHSKTLSRDLADELKNMSGTTSSPQSPKKKIPSEKNNVGNETFKNAYSWASQGSEILPVNINSDSILQNLPTTGNGSPIKQNASLSKVPRASSSLSGSDSTPQSPRLAKSSLTSRPSSSGTTISRKPRSEGGGYIIIRSKKPAQMTAKILEKFTAKLNSVKNVSYFTSATSTRKGNIRLNLGAGFTYTDVHDARVIPPSFELVDSSDWFYLTAHGVPRTHADKKLRTPTDLAEICEDVGIKLSKAPEWIDHIGPKGTVKLSFDSREARDSAYFMRALYINNDRAKFRFYPDEWYGNARAITHEETFKNGKPLVSFQFEKHALRFFQANCGLDLQVSHDVLFEMNLQAHVVLVESPWIFSDGRPVERNEWDHHYEQHFYEAGGSRVALYRCKVPVIPPVFDSFTKDSCILVHYIADFVIVQVDRPSGWDVESFYLSLSQAIKSNDDKPMVISGCFNLQHKMWDGSMAESNTHTEKIAKLLKEYEFERISPLPSNFIDEDDYYTNPTLLFAQKSLVSRISISNAIDISNTLQYSIKDYHRLAWEIKLPDDFSL